MLEDLILIHSEVMSHVKLDFKRYLYSQIRWKASGLCVLGDRGVGKTTMLCQNLLERFGTPDKALYISADHIHVASIGLFNIAQSYFSHGGEALYIDEVHKYPNWSIEIKNILDTYKTKQVIFSGSSSLDLNKSKGDLSRRVIYHRLSGLSFREYLFLAHKVEIPVMNFSEILEKHVGIASDLKHIPILKYFKEYLEHGYYPFFIESLKDYASKISNVMEKVLFEDVAVIYNLRQSTVPILKKILWLVATSNGLVPNVDKMSKNLGASREMVYNCLEYLNHSGLLLDVFPAGKGNALIRKPGKIYLGNTNLLKVIYGMLKFPDDCGGIRETFFVNQTSLMNKVTLHEKGDFLVDDHWIIEVGGKGKTYKQIQGEKDAYLVVDDLPIGFGHRVPLYLFGFLY